MKQKTWAAALTAGLCILLGSDAVAQTKTIPSPPDDSPGTINISCYRGPLRTIAWDRPNAVFIQDLVQLGYTYPEARAMGMRICRDEYGLDDAEYKIATLKRLLRENPPK